MAHLLIPTARKPWDSAPSRVPLPRSFPPSHGEGAADGAGAVLAPLASTGLPAPSDLSHWDRDPRELVLGAWLLLLLLFPGKVGLSPSQGRGFVLLFLFYSGKGGF